MMVVYVKEEGVKNLWKKIVSYSNSKSQRKKNIASHTNLIILLKYELEADWLIKKKIYRVFKLKFLMKS